MSDYEKGAEILRIIRGEDPEWVSKVLEVRVGVPVPQGWRHIDLKATAKVVSEDEASRALAWADVIWITEAYRIDAQLVDLVEKRGQAIAEARRIIDAAEHEFCRKIDELNESESTAYSPIDVLNSHPTRKSECDSRRSATSASWLEINRERILAQSASARGAQGASYSNKSAESRDQEERQRRKNMEIIAAWIDQEEKRRAR